MLRAINFEFQSDDRLYISFIHIHVCAIFTIIDSDVFATGGGIEPSH